MQRPTKRPTRRPIGRPALCLGAALLLLAGCSAISNSPMNPFNWFSSSTNKPAELTPIKATLTMTRIWSASVGKAGVFVFTPAQSGGSIYAAAADGDLTAFEALTGKQKWRIQANKAGLSAGVGADDGVIAVGTAKGEVLAFDDAGQPKWRAQVSSEILGSPLVTDRLVVVRSADNRVFAFSAIDGKRQWIYQRTAPALVLRNFGSMAAAGGVIFAGFPGGKMVALTVGSGAVRWEATVALPKGATELERIADISSAPVISGREVCAVAFQGRAACFDMANGQPQWTRDISSATGMAADTRYAFVSDEKSAVVALARQTGSSLWKQDKLLYRTVSAPVSVGLAVIVGDYQGQLHALSREDGSFIGRQATDGSGIAAPPQPVEIAGKDAFLVQTRNGGLMVFTL